MAITSRLLAREQTIVCLLCCYVLKPSHALTTASRSYHGRSHLVSTRRQLFSHQSTKLLSLEALKEAIHEAYSRKETDGVLELANTVNLIDYDPDDVVFASLEAVNGHKGMAAGVLNGWMGACCQMDDAEAGSGFAWSLLNAYEEAQESTQMSPDIVTFSLAYSALTRVQKKNSHVLAEQVMERANHMSKKKGGNKRRKSLAASRRSTSAASAMDVQDELEQQCDGLRVLQESPHFLVVSKPSGIVCVHKRKTTDREGKDVSLVDALLKNHIPLSSLNPEGRGLVHRIDRGTSGCIILAKTNDAHAKLVAEFFLRNVHKKYRAVVYGPNNNNNNDNDDNGGDGNGAAQTIDIPVNGRPAQSSYRILHQYSDTVSELEVETSTGRKHQVRVHCAKGLNRPILLDPIYTNAIEWSNEKLFPAALRNQVTEEKRQKIMLHASSLSIPSFDVDVQSPVPDWWDEVIRGVQQKS